MPQLTPERAAEFERCRRQVLEETFFQHGIGSLSERESHAILKNFYCPDPSCQEINIGGFVADISDSSGITEIQSRGFGKLRRKLQCFLPNYPVRIVLPIAAVRWLIWVDPQTGELLSRRRCAPGSPLLLFRELYSILDLLWPDSLRVTLAMLECEEYRLKDGRGPDGKKGAHRSQLLPLRLIEEIDLTCPADLLTLLPPLPEQFHSAQLRCLTRARPRAVSYVIQVLRRLELIEQIGVENRFHIYRLVKDPPLLGSPNLGEPATSSPEG